MNIKKIYSVLALSVLVIAALSCNLGAPSLPPISEAISVPKSTATPLPTLAFTPTPTPPKTQVEIWSYSMLYRDGACPAPGEHSLLALAAYLDTRETAIQDAELEITLKMLPGSETATFITNHYSIGKSTQGESGFGFPLDVGVIMMSEFPNQAIAPQAVEVTYTLSLLDGNMNPLATLPPESFIFCSSTPQDVSDFRAARGSKLGSGTPDLAVQMVVSRYDSAKDEGTLEMTVCNIGSEVASPFYGGIQANGTSVQMTYNASLRPGECAGVFDPASTFQFYGITQSGTVPVQASINPQDGNDPPANNVFTNPAMLIDHIVTAKDDLTAYQKCRTSQPHQMCWGEAPDTPKSDPHEVLKAWEGVSVIVPFDYATLANLQLSTLANCRTQVVNFLGESSPIRMQMLLSQSSGFGAGTGGMELLDTEDIFQLMLSGIHPEINWNNVFSGQCGLSNYLSP